MKRLFYPRSVAVIGASRREHAVGHGVLHNLLFGGFFESKTNIAFKGGIYAVNPNADKVLELQSYKNINEIEARIDLAVIAVKASIVKQVVQDCIAKKVKAVIVISAGFAELGDEGRQMQTEIAAMLKEAGIDLVGPNCLGIINTHHGLNASFAPAMPPKGEIGFITQSGALADSVIDWAIEKNYGFSKLISFGNAAGLDINDFIEYLNKDKETKAIALYVESIADGRRFMRIAKKSKKPIVVLKAGKTEQGLKAVSSHTGSLAGSYEVYKAAFKQSNVYVAENIESLFETAKAMALQPRLRENSIAIITNGGGAGVVTADECSEEGLKLAKLDSKTITKLDESGKMHPAWSRNNPVDIVGDALPERYESAISIVLEQKDIHGLIVIQTLQTMTNSMEDAKIIIEAKKKFKKKPIIGVFMGGHFIKFAQGHLRKNGIPVFNDPKKAVYAMKALLYDRD